MWAWFGVAVGRREYSVGAVKRNDWRAGLYWWRSKYKCVISCYYGCRFYAIVVMGWGIDDRAW